LSSQLQSLTALTPESGSNRNRRRRRRKEETEESYLHYSGEKVISMFVIIS
jgi:hypothetical protein